MRVAPVVAAAIVLTGAARVGAQGGRTMEQGMVEAGQWAAAHLDEGTAPPFSFQYGGRPSAELLKRWKVAHSARKLDEQRTERTVSYRDDATGLVARCVAVTYLDYPTVEWTVYLKNTGRTATPLLADIQALDVRFDRGKTGEFTVRHWTGSHNAANDYEPHRTELGANGRLHVTTAGGRGTDSDMPYFNIEWPGESMIAVIGWPGQWAADFSREDETELRIRGGQELTHLKLLPGEEIRTPLAVLQFSKGDWIDAQNTWRRWMIGHNLPRPGGKLLPPISIMCTSDFYPGMRSNAADEIKYADAYVKAGAKPDYWWIDAGWYPCNKDWTEVGTWEPDPKRYPHGIREVADHVHGLGMKLVVWFEPERVHAGSWLAENHPEWVLARKTGGKNGGLLNLGNPAARAWLTDHIDKMITEQGIDLYRQDFNMEPLAYWRHNDPPDRQGITEIRHVEGYLAYWDELRRRHPDMSIDSCASGGRRNDLETLRRAVPLLRSDYRTEPLGTQGHTYGISSWIPYYGTGVPDTSDYIVRTHWCPCLGIGRNEPRTPSLDWTTYHRYMAEWRSAAELMLGDYYPLTSYSLDATTWIAWQFDRPDLGEGMVQAFRRADSVYESGRFKLRGLEADASYSVANISGGLSEQHSGRDLMETGLLVAAPRRDDAVVMMYRKVGLNH